MRVRSVLSGLLRAALLTVLALQALWLLRRPIAERWLCGKLAALASDQLDAEVSIGGLGGDWLVTAVATGVEVRGARVLRRIDGAEVAVEVDLLRLLRGDLSGLRRARATARAVELDLTAPGEGGGGGQPPDLGRLARLFPGGARVAAESCTVRGRHGEVHGPLLVRLAPEREGGPRRLAVDAPMALIDGEVEADGTVHAFVRTPDAGAIARVLGAGPDQVRGRAEARATLVLAPELRCSVHAQAADLTVAGVAVERAAAHGRIDRAGVHGADGTFVLAGGLGSGDARGVELSFAGALLRAGEVCLRVADLAPFTAYLPAAARERGPLGGALHLRADLDGARARVDVAARIVDPVVGAPVRIVASARGDADGLALDAARVEGPALALRGSAVLPGTSLARTLAEPALLLDAPIAASATLSSDALHALPLRAFGLDARGSLAVEAELRGSLHRPVADFAVTADGVALGPADGTPWVRDLDLGAVGRPDRIRIDHAALTLADHRLFATGAVELDDDVVRIERLAVADVHRGTAVVSGTIARRAGFDWRAALRDGADLLVDLDGVEPLHWLVEGRGPVRVSGRVYWRTGARIDVGATLHVAGEPAPGMPISVTLAAHGDGRRSVIDPVMIVAGPSVSTATFAVERSPLALLEDPRAFAGARASGRIDLGAVPLRAVLGALGVALPAGEAAGTVRGSATLGGRLDRPELRGQVQLEDGFVRLAAGERFENVDATVVLRPTAVRLLGSAERGKAPIQFSGELTAAGALWQAWPKVDLALSVRGDNVLIHRRTGLKVRADVDLEARGPIDDVLIRGKVALRDGKLVTRVPLIDLRRTGGAAPTSGIRLPSLTLPPPLHARLAVDVVTAEPFVAQSNVLEAELHAALELTGDLDAPRLVGTVSGPDAAIILPGLRMRASTLLLEFTSAEPELPRLTVNARGRRHGYDIQLDARGRYDRPDVVLASSPALPPDELVVLVTTGARPAALRSTTGVGTVLGAYVAQEFADWLFGSESTEAKESFLDRFTVETGTEMSRAGNESIVVEFRVGERLYLQGERDVYEDINMGVVYRLRFR